MASSTGQLKPGHEFRVDLRVDPQGRGISGVQVWIEYDPAIFQPVGAEPGDLLGQGPIEAGPIIDEVNGVFQYAAARIGSTQPPTPPGLFARVTFRALETAGAGKETFLKIAGVKIPDENIQEIRDIIIGEKLRVEISP